MNYFFRMICLLLHIFEMLICAREVICLLSSDMDNHLIFYPMYMPFSVNLPSPPSSHLKPHYIWKIISSVWDIWIHINSLCTNFILQISLWAKLQSHPLLYSLLFETLSLCDQVSTSAIYLFPILCLFCWSMDPLLFWHKNVISWEHSVW